MDHLKDHSLFALGLPGICIFFTKIGRFFWGEFRHTFYTQDPEDPGIQLEAVNVCPLFGCEKASKRRPKLQSKQGSSKLVGG